MTNSMELNGLVNFKNGIKNGIYKANTKDKVYFIGGKYKQKGKKGHIIDFTVDGQVQVQDVQDSSIKPIKTLSFSAGQNNRHEAKTRFKVYKVEIDDMKLNNVGYGIADVQLGHNIDASGADPVVPLKIVFDY